MEQILIKGPCTLSGTVSVQGSKNSSMKHVLMPLLANDVFTLKNIPDIGSTRKLLELVILQGAHVSWNGNTVIVDTRQVSIPQLLPAELFYYTSGAIFLIPILTFKYGSCSVEEHPERTDTGGDKIGTREFSQVLETLRLLGIMHRKEGKVYHFFVDKLTPLDFAVPVRSFSVSVMATIASLFKHGTSTIRHITGEADFEDTLRFLKSAGVSIAQTGDTLVIQGDAVVKGTTFENMFDRHDYITFLAAALATNSEITISNVHRQQMKLDCLDTVLAQMGIQIELRDTSCHIPAQREKLYAANIIAGLYPQFITEWQVLFAPLLTQVNGVSTVVETVYTNRMRHWEELGKMGAKYEFIRHPEYPEVANNPRAVTVTGPVHLQGAPVIANDLRAGAALIIAGLVAEGHTLISEVDHVHRGYERLVERLQDLGATISYVP